VPAKQNDAKRLKDMTKDEKRQYMSMKKKQSKK
jgi:hypothetical protein